jgi:uncharacterized cupredoxin-like copper-binding protein
MAMASSIGRRAGTPVIAHPSNLANRPFDREALVRPRPWQLATVAVLFGAAAALAAAAVAGPRPGAGPEPRTVVVTMHHSHFTPSVVRVEPGERVRFVLRNTDPIDHEFILGDAAVQARHEQGRQRQHHGDVPGERSVPAGQEAATTYTFAAAPGGGTLEFACHLPGHYAYGMHGTVQLSGR